MRVAALVGILAATALAALLFFLGRGGAEEGGASAPTAAPPAAASQRPSSRPSAQTARPATRPATSPATSPPRAAGPRSSSTGTRSGFPPAIDQALRRHGVVVVAVTLPGSAVDAFVRSEARQGALLARAGYVAVSAASERAVRPLVARTGVLPEPAVIVLRRPGVVVATLGVTDRELVAQVAARARR